MADNFSPTVKDIITTSKQIAIGLGNDFIGTEHLILGLLKNSDDYINLILNKFNFDFKSITKSLEKKLKKASKGDIVFTEQKVNLTRQAEKALKTTFLEAKLEKAKRVESIHLLLCILRNENDWTTKVLNKNNIDYDSVKDTYKELLDDKTIQFTRPATPEITNVEEASKPGIPDIKLTEVEFEPIASSISLYFLDDEYSNDEIAEVLTLLSDLYREVGGKGLVIKGHDILEYDSVLEPLCV